MLTTAVYKTTWLIRLPNYYLFMQDDDGNTMFNPRYVGGFMMVAALVLSFVVGKSPLPQGAIFFMGLLGFVLMVINNFKGTR